jgi:hypothetical protein
MEETKDVHTRIIEAFSFDGCPLCAILWRNELDSLYQWVGESDENAKYSERIRQLLEAGGFCSYHFLRFEQMCTHSLCDRQHRRSTNREVSRNLKGKQTETSQPYPQAQREDSGRMVY